MALLDALAHLLQNRCGAAAAGRARAQSGSRKSCTRSCSRPGRGRMRARDPAARRPARSRSRRRHRRRTPRVSSLRRATTVTLSGMPSNARSRFAPQPVTYTRRCVARRSPSSLPRLADRLVRHAARVHRPPRLRPAPPRARHEGAPRGSRAHPSARPCSRGSEPRTSPSARDATRVGTGRPPNPPAYAARRGGNRGSPARRPRSSRR